MEKEQSWFPDEYRDHVNYQWMVLLILQNQLKAGNTHNAKTRMTPATFHPADLRSVDLQQQPSFIVHI